MVNVLHSPVCESILALILYVCDELGCNPPCTKFVFNPLLIICPSASISYPSAPFTGLHTIFISLLDTEKLIPDGISGRVVADTVFHSLCAPEFFDLTINVYVLFAKNPVFWKVVFKPLSTIDPSSCLTSYPVAPSTPSHINLTVLPTTVTLISDGGSGAVN